MNIYREYTHTPTLNLTPTTALTVRDKTHQSGYPCKKSMLVCGFTLIELLMVISIIGLLSSVVLSSLNSARDKARIAAGQKFSVHTDHAIRDELIGEWLFEGNSNDTSGYGNHAVLYGTPLPGYVSGVTSMNNAISFDGLTQYAAVVNPDRGILDVGNRDSYTVSFWMKSTNKGGDVSVSEHWEGDGYPWSIRGPNASGVVSFSIYNGTCPAGCCGVGVNSIKNVADGKFHHFTFIRDFDRQTVSLYVDGVFTQEKTTIALSCGVGWYDDVSSTDGSFAIGARKVVGTKYLAETIDDFRVYSKALVFAQIQQLYAEGLAGHRELASN